MSVAAWRDGGRGGCSGRPDFEVGAPAGMTGTRRLNVVGAIGNVERSRWVFIFSGEGLVKLSPTRGTMYTSTTSLKRWILELNGKAMVKVSA